ncbi:MAG: hypothetical protein ABI164_09045, partial [Acidobacteriaceae bacterium]
MPYESTATLASIRFWLRSLLLCGIALAATLHAQQVTLHARSSLVMVPTLVEGKNHEPVFNLGARDFV